jgi:hypothetical protein
MPTAHAAAGDGRGVALYRRSVRRCRALTFPVEIEDEPAVGFVVRNRLPVADGQAVDQITIPGLLSV